MESNKYKIFFAFTVVIGVVLIAAGLFLFIPKSVRSDTPDIYFYNVYSLRIMLPVSGILLIVIGSSVYSSYKALKAEINALKDSYRVLERKLTK